jgi:hypothetical protein
MTSPSYERYVVMRNHAAQEPTSGGTADTAEEFVVRVHNHVHRVPKSKYETRSALIEQTLRKLKASELEFCGLRGRYLYSKKLDDELVARTTRALENIGALRAYLQELRSEESLFVSNGSSSPPAPSPSRPTVSATDSSLKEKLREAKRNGMERHFLFKTYEQCTSAASKKPFYMSKDRIAEAVSKHYPELIKKGKSAKSLSKRELCKILFD